MSLKETIKKKFLNADGTINGTVVASFVTLLIVLIQQVMMACGFTYGHWDQVAAIVNTALTILGLCGFVEGNGKVEAPNHLTIKQSASGIVVESKPAQDDQQPSGMPGISGKPSVPHLPQVSPDENPMPGTKQANSASSASLAQATAPKGALKAKGVPTATELAKSDEKGGDAPNEGRTK